MQLCGSLIILWHCLSLGLEWKLTFSSPVAVFQICWHIECSIFTASSSRIWNSSTGIPSPSLALFIVMLPNAHLTSHSGCLALGEWSHHRDYLCHEVLYSFVQFSCVFLEKAMALHSSTLAWKIPWLEEPGGLQSMRLLRVGHDWATSFSPFTFMHWRR